MEPRISFVTLGVTDLERATRFYAEGLRLPRLKSPPTVSFFEPGLTWFALYPRDLLAADAGVSPHGSGFPGFALAHNVRSEAEADRLLKEVAAAGGRIVKPAQRAEWGGYSGYFAESRWLPVGSSLEPPLPSCLVGGDGGQRWPFPKRGNERSMKRT